MKRINLLFLVFVIFNTSCTTPQKAKKQTILQYYSNYEVFPEILNGQIKSVKEVTYSVVDNAGIFEKGEIYTDEDRKIKKWNWDFTSYYNEKGQLTKTAWYNGTEKADVCILVYEDNLLVKTLVEVNDTVKWHHLIENDEKGHVSGFKVLDVEKDSITWIGKLKLNDDGFIMKQTNYTPDKKLLNTNICIRGENKLTKEFIRYDNTDSLEIKIKINYNEKGFFIFHQRFDAEGEIIRTYNLEYTDYDEMGNWLSKTVFRNDTAMVICNRFYEYY